MIHYGWYSGDVERSSGEVESSSGVVEWSSGVVECSSGVVEEFSEATNLVWFFIVFCMRKTLCRASI